MKRAEQISFDSFKKTKTGFRFFYTIDGQPLSLYLSLEHRKITLPEEVIKAVLSAIGLAYLIDLAAICYPKNILLKPVFLNQSQLKFWQEVLAEVCLERSYVEKTDLLFLKTKWLIDKRAEKFIVKPIKKLGENLTICMSGGKESLTALKLFKKYPRRALLFFDYNDENSYHLRKMYNYFKPRTDYYQLSTNLSHTHQLQKKYACRYSPTFTIGQLVFISLLFGDQIKYLLIGNEYSANFGNAKYKGRIVNHQFDKTLLFAQKINQYLKKYFAGMLTYTSPFFGWYEYKITEMFFADRDYLDIWTSCNHSKKKHNFCCRCPKCAFIYMISLPYLEKKLLDRYFYRCPLDNLRLCKPLIDLEAEKPTDCVGEKKECWVALDQISQQNKAEGTKVVQYFNKTIFPRIKSNLSEFEAEVTQEHTDLQYLPKELIRYLPKKYFNVNNFTAE